MNLAVLIACFGLVAVTSFGMIAKRGLIAGPISAAIGWLQVPAAIAMLWRLSQIIGWWTILAFIACSIAAGFSTGSVLVKAMRGSAEDLQFLLAVQTMAGLAYLACAIACWLL